NDKVLDDVDLLYHGSTELAADFWDDLNRLESWTNDGRTFYQIEGDVVKDWYCNQLVYSPDESHAIEAVVRKISDGAADIELIHDYRKDSHAIWGITARNREQNFALNLLMDPAVDFVSLLGQAGTGKTLLTLAAALTQTIEHKQYIEIIMTRVTVPVGEDIGFLPGTEEEKMTPWMGALMDNLEVLNKTEVGDDWARQATNDLLQSRIKIRSLNFMRGRTFLNRFIIIDEAQNLTSKQMKTLITRAGPGSKIVCLGNIAQIDTPYLSETTSGLTYVVDRFKNWEHGGHITLLRGERSRLADFASEHL
ncbi:phosphate starvation-inducible protein PhoH, partial [Methylophaga sp. 42_8_T64]